MRKIYLFLLFTITIAFSGFAREYKVSSMGEDFIKSYEKLELKRYHCGNEKFWTIGYGHRIVKGENYKTITRAQAEKLFRQDMDKVNKSVNRLLANLPHSKKVVYRQGVIDALGSLIYNCGETGVKNTTFYKRLKACRYDNKKKCIRKSDWDFTLSAIKDTNIIYNGHKYRRRQEYKLATS